MLEWLWGPTMLMTWHEECFLRSQVKWLWKPQQSTLTFPCNWILKDPRYRFYWWRWWEDCICSHYFHCISVPTSLFLSYFISPNASFLFLSLTAHGIQHYIAVMLTFCWFLISGFPRGWASNILLKLSYQFEVPNSSFSSNSSVQDHHFIPVV